MKGEKVMSRNVYKILSGALISFSLFAITANAEWRQDSNGWWYAESNSYATGWRLIGGEWYYFKEDGYMVAAKYCKFYNNIGSYSTSGTSCNGEYYFFDEDGHMLHDCFIIDGSGAFQSWIDSNGHLALGDYGNKYSGKYNLSQSDLSYIPSLYGYTETEGKELAEKIGLKLNVIYENVPKSELDNIILAQNNIDTHIIKNETESTIVVGKYSGSTKNWSENELRNLSKILDNKYGSSYSHLHFWGLSF